MCPYIIKNRVHTVKNIPNMDMPEYIEKSVEIEIWNYSECEREKCGAWNEGKCRYNEQSRN